MKSVPLSTVVDKLKSHLSKKEIITISRVVIIEESNPALEVFQNAITVEHGSSEIKNSNFFGVQIRHAFIITSQKSRSEVG
ncbi:MAG: hypothetical protein LAT57_11705 [Balneolales bacterium]|nr:hypothetical protein [Balneolales bacterium]